MPDEWLNREDWRDFMSDQFKPFMDRFDRHLNADEQRFAQITDAIHRVSTSIEVQASTQQALVAQGDRLFNSKWVRITAIAVVMAPLVAVAIAIFK